MATSPDTDGPIVESVRIAASPVARKLARETDLDLHTIQGSGPGGRIVKADIERSERSRPASLPPPASKEPPSPEPWAAQFPRVPFETRPISAIRRAIAKRLSASKQSIPHIYLTIDCNGGGKSV